MLFTVSYLHTQFHNLYPVLQSFTLLFPQRRTYAITDDFPRCQGLVSNNPFKILFLTLSFMPSLYTLFKSFTHTQDSTHRTPHSYCLKSDTRFNWPPLWAGSTYRLSLKNCLKPPRPIQFQHNLLSSQRLNAPYICSLKKQPEPLTKSCNYLQFIYLFLKA